MTYIIFAFAALFTLGLFEARECNTESVADGGAVLNHADFQSFHLAAEPRVIEGQGRERVSAAGKNHHADAVVAPLGNEGLNDRLDRLQPVDSLAIALVIFRLHRAGKIDREHEIVALLLDLAFVLDDLRPRERNDQEHEAGHGHHGGPA